MTDPVDPYAPPKARLEVDDGKGKGKLLPHQSAARILKVLGWMLVILGGVLAIGLGYLMWANTSVPEAVPLIVILFLLSGVTAILFITAHGLSAKKRWARIVGVLMGIVMLPGFPVWSIVGIYLLFQLSYAWKKAEE